MLPPLLTVPSAASNLLAESLSKEEELRSSHFSILASVDDAGHVVLAAFGTFPLQQLQLDDNQKVQKLLALELSTDLRCLAVLSQSGDDLSVLVLDVRSSR